MSWACRRSTSSLPRGNLPAPLQPTGHSMTAPRVRPVTALLLSLAIGPSASLAAQNQAAGPARLEITPARREVVVGDSLQLAARALDAPGHAITDATLIFKPEGLAAASLDSTGRVRARGVGDILVIVTALV